MNVVYCNYSCIISDIICYLYLMYLYLFILLIKLVEDYCKHAWLMIYTKHEC